MMYRQCDVNRAQGEQGEQGRQGAAQDKAARVPVCALELELFSLFFLPTTTTRVVLIWMGLAAPRPPVSMRAASARHPSQKSAMMPGDDDSNNCLLSSAMTVASPS